MDKKIKYSFVLAVFIGFSSLITVQAQGDTDYGASFTFEVTKELNRFFRLNVDEEVRLVDNNRYKFDRSSTTLGVDYEIIRSKMRTGVFYSFLYLYNSDYLFEARHRYFFHVSYKEEVGSFTLSWRGRFQSTVRDENRGAYKVNPKYILRNRIQAEYNIWKSRWVPFLSCELANPLNDSRYDLNRIRIQGGTEYRLSRYTYLNAFLRYDTNFESGDHNRLILGVGYRIKM
ncbi:MAG: DUF2490 domain-containing protein [Dysgonamonadaceae bacterium]|jgi:hypothetical protein|nr:DUF2490 domain-containing protein [Dysgonamonadaceae bacterium]